MAYQVRITLLVALVLSLPIGAYRYYRAEAEETCAQKVLAEAQVLGRQKIMHVEDAWIDGPQAKDLDEVEFQLELLHQRLYDC